MSQLALTSAWHGASYDGLVCSTLKRVPSRAGKLLHFRQEASIAPLRASWAIRAHQPLSRRVPLTALIGLLGTRVGGRLAVNYAIGARLRSDWRVVGTGREQIVCEPEEGNGGHVVKIVMGAMSSSAAVLELERDRYVTDESELREGLGRYLTPADYSIETIDRRRRLSAVVARQERVEIVDSIFHHDAVLGPLARELPAEIRRDIVERITNYYRTTGKMVDIVGIGNFVFVKDRETPTLIDSLPIGQEMLRIQPADSDRSIHDEIQARLDILERG